MLWALDAAIGGPRYYLAIWGLPLLILLALVGFGAVAFYLTWREHHRK